MREMSWAEVIETGLWDEKGYGRERNVIIGNKKLGVKTSG